MNWYPGKFLKESKPDYTEEQFITAPITSIRHDLVDRRADIHSGPEEWTFENVMAVHIPSTMKIELLASVSDTDGLVVIMNFLNSEPANAKIYQVDKANVVEIVPMQSSKRW